MSLRPGEPFDVLDRVPESARAGVRLVAFETTASLEDAVEAFLAVREMAETDEIALAALRKVAASGLSLRTLSPLPPPPRAEILPGGDTVRVEGGARALPLPPERAFDGTPDPEVARTVAEGRARYHLETLRGLEAESRSVEEDALPPPAPGRSLRPVLALAGIAGILSLAGVAAPREEKPPLRRRPSPPPRPIRLDAPELEELDPVEEVRLEHLGRDLARAALRNLSGEEGAENPSTRVDAEDVKARLDRALSLPPLPGCGAAPCRTLGDCLCTCKLCKTACASRRRRR